MIARPPVMPPTTDPASLLRRAKTNQIQNAFQNQRQPPRVGYLGPPTAQPPSATITPIGIGQSDPFTAPPTHQPPISGPTPFPYQVFQNALHASGRDVPAFGSPGAMSGGQDAISLPTIPGGGNDAPLPTGGEQQPNPTGLGFTENGNPILPQGGNPTPGNFHGGDLGLHTGDLGDAGTRELGDWSDLWQNPNNWMDNPNYAGNPEADNTDNIPGGSGRGGTSGGTTPRAWDFGIGRLINFHGIPIGELAHRGMEAYRNWQMNHPAAGPGGRGGGGTGGGNTGLGETPDQRARGDANFTMAGGNSYYDAPISGSHFDYGTGRYVMDRGSNNGFLRNFAPEHQITDPFKFGKNTLGDAGRVHGTEGPQTGLRALRTMYQLSTAAQRARNAQLTTVQGAMNAGRGY